MQVRLFKPSVGEAELARIRDVFERSWLGLGPLVSEFEAAWKSYIGSRAALGLNSGTAALHLALAGYGFRPGAKVLVPAMTFVATASAPLYNGLEPVFVDSDADTLSISLEDLEAKCTPDCVAVIPVHLGGHPVPMDRLLEIARRRNLKVIEDCAHCTGGSYQGKKLGTWGDLGCFSFEEKKCMTTGDGGMLVSDDVELMEQLRPRRWVGMDKDTWRRVGGYTKQEADARHWYYEVSVLGYKYNMNDLAAAIGLAQLEKLDAMNSRRREIIRRYLDGIRGLSSIRPLLPYDTESGVYWYFGVRCERRDELIHALKERQIATGVHYMPLTLHPLFKDCRGGVPVMDRVWKTMVTLPLFADLTDVEVDYVVQALRDFDGGR
jgi:perosamine synthetase